MVSPFLSLFGLESVAKLYDVQIHTKAGRSIQAGIGEVLEAKAGIHMRYWVNADSHGRDELNRPPEVLFTELVPAEVG